MLAARFTLSVMSDNFIDIILGALNEVDMSKVQRKTDRVSTFIEGNAKDVFEVVQAVYKSAGKIRKAYCAECHVFNRAARRIF